MSFAWRKRWFILLLPVLLAVTAWHIRIDTDINAFFTATDSEESALLAGFLQSGELSRRYLLAVEPAAEAPGQEESAAPLDRFTAEFIKRLEGLSDVERVWPADAPPRGWLEALRSYAPYHERIYSLNPGEERTLFDPAQLGKRAEALKKELLSPEGAFLKPIVKQDPLLLSLHGFKAMDNPFEKQAGAGAGRGGLMLESRPAALDTQAQKRLQTAIHERFDTLNRAFGGVFRLGMTGIPLFTVFAQAEISRDITLVSIVSSVGVALVFLLLFHSFSALHWMMMIQAASFALGTLATALVFGRVHSLTLALGASLIGISTDYPIHVLAHCAKHRHSPLSAARLLWPSLVMGGLTTVVGYAALGLTGFPGLEQIAVFAAASIVASLGLTRWVLPALLGDTDLHPAHLPGIVAWVGFCERRRVLLLGVVAAGLIASVLVLPRMRWMDDLQKLAVDMSELKRQDEIIRSRFPRIEAGRFVLVQASDMETALQRSEAAERRLRQLGASGAVAEFHGLFPWLVSGRLQEENERVYRQALTPKFLASWRAALKAAGLSVDKLGDLSSGGEEPLRPQAVLDTAVRQILSGQIIEQKGGVALAIWLGDHDPAKLAEGLLGLEGVRYFSQRDEVNRMAEQHRDRSLEMLGYGIVIMCALIWLQQRSLTRVFLTLLPTLASSLFVFAAWAVMGEEVSFLHVIGLLLSISLCVDYGIFFMDNRGKDTDVTYHAIASSTLTTLASFGALGLARTPTLPILGVSVSLGVTLGFLLCPLLIRGGSDAGKNVL